MGVASINATFWNRLLTLFAYRVTRYRYFRLSGPGSGSIVYVTSKLCIKASRFTTLAEANAMQFVSRNTSIPVPKIYCAFKHKAITYIVMERIDGTMANDGWGFRSPESKMRILEQLKSMINQLRNIPPPDDIGVANVDGGPIFDERLPNKSIWGPFRTINDFHRELRDGIEASQLDDTSATGLRELCAFHDEPWPRPVFTHGDLSSFNIMVRGDEVVGIIDWETAGWMPPYWEYASAWNAAPMNEFWQDEVDKFVTPMPRELEMEAIRRRWFAAI
ncbi:kinase-like domain-containing protein [Phialemonium atrogriseum]|uniref:Kinase-like domain-containing protein n=1 Tax=Phialemonium atrogriseum TaxID=1093897 RepID=A0AAJ0FQP3_9PEZI|nr:kinase-like domain-containing protein [Phialemonium atrogriseum]KAK1771463.1 kinase-like domain-containing protein [Phialemonium atrogriseum]